MIMVDVYVPSLDRDYDFEIDENAPIHMVVEEISAMICQKEQCSLRGNAADLALCDRESQRIMPYSRTLEECQVKTGTRLILV